VTSKLGEKPVPAVAADANVLLSAVLGHAALRVFTLTDVSVLTTQGVLQEVREYLPLVAKQYDILPQALEGQLRLLAVRECEPKEYATKLEAAKRAIARRDPDDGRWCGVVHDGSATSSPGSLEMRRARASKGAVTCVQR